MMMCCSLKCLFTTLWHIWMKIRLCFVPADGFSSLLMMKKRLPGQTGSHPNSCQCLACTIWGMRKNYTPQETFQEAEICCFTNLYLKFLASSIRASAEPVQN